MGIEIEVSNKKTKNKRKSIKINLLAFFYKIRWALDKKIICAKIAHMGAQSFWRSGKKLKKLLLKVRLWKY